MKRIYITGIAGISSAGQEMADIWQTVCQQNHVFSSIEGGFTAGLIPHYDPKKLLADHKLLRVISKSDVLGLHAVQKALAQGESISSKAGIFVASPGNIAEQHADVTRIMALTQAEKISFARQVTKLLRPTWLLTTLPNNVLSYISMQYGIKGYNQNFLNHQVGSLQAIGTAFEMIQHGVIDRAIVVGYDVPGNGQNLKYYDNLGLLSHSNLIPYAQQSTGTILAEGAGALILESEESATQHNATIYGEITGFATLNTPSFFAQSDRYQDTLTALNETYTLLSKQTTLSDQTLIIGNACGIESLDHAEMAFIQRHFDAKKACLTAFKPCIGNTRAASVPLELALGLKALEKQELPKPKQLAQMDSNIQPYFKNTLEKVQQGLIIAANINGGGVGMLSFKIPN